MGKKHPPSAAPTGFLIKSVEVDNRWHDYVVYVPRDYDPAKAWPVILFLHGRGERGSDGLLQTDVGLGRAIRRNPERLPAIAVFPQCPDTVHWDGALDIAEAAFKQTLAEYHTDPSRYYLTGLSMGGYGTWIYGAQTADTWAALLPICGGGNVADAQRLAQVPIWAFHGADDTVVPPERSREMVAAVKAAGGTVHYTEYPETAHNAWDQAYGDPKVVKWLLKQRK